MFEKKIITLGVRMPESMHLKVKGLAEADGITDSEFARMAITNLVNEYEARYIRLHSIFGNQSHEINPQCVEQCSTDPARSAYDDPAVRKNETQNPLADKGLAAK